MLFMLAAITLFLLPVRFRLFLFLSEFLFFNVPPRESDPFSRTLVEALEVERCRVDPAGRSAVVPSTVSVSWFKGELWLGLPTVGLKSAESLCVARVRRASRL